MKRIFIILIMFFTMFIIYSCDPVENNTLTISLEEDMITWDAYPDAKSYYIYVDNTQVATVYDLYYELKLKEGTYQVKIKASLSVGYSEYSNVVTYISNGSNVEVEKKQLAAPILKLNGDAITWNKVNNAISYKIYVDNNLVSETNELSYTFTKDEFDHQVYVVAVGDNVLYTNSVKSNVLDIYKVIINDDNNKTGIINIFSINDTHGAILTDDSVVGMEKVQSVINTITDPIKVANGDIFQGGYTSNVTYGKVFIDILNEMQFDCFVIGNHEFDWGLEKISVYNDDNLENGEADFPFLSANIVYKDTGTTLEWLDPYTIVEQNGIRVGIIGVIGEYLTSSISQEYLTNYEFLDPVPIVGELSSTLRNEENCDIVVVATHEYEQDTNDRFASLKGDESVDAILCAHTHQKKAEYVTRSDGYKIPVMQSNTKNYTVGNVTLNVEKGNITNTSIIHYYPRDYQSDERILEVIGKYQNIIDEGKEKIGYSYAYMSKGDLGMLAVNAMREYTNCDFAIMNTGGVRTTIDAGDILVEDIYEVFPFDNNIVYVTMTNQQLLNFYRNADGYIYISENFNPYNLTASSYTVAVIDYVYTYPYYQKYFQNLPALITENYIRDAVIWKLKVEQ